MNNRQISEQAGVDEDVYTWNQIQLERFAELVRQDERERVYNTLISGDCDGSVKTYIRKILEQGANNR